MIVVGEIRLPTFGCEVLDALKVEDDVACMVGEELGNELIGGGNGLQNLSVSAFPRAFPIGQGVLIFFRDVTVDTDEVRFRGFDGGDVRMVVTDVERSGVPGGELGSEFEQYMEVGVSVFMEFASDMVLGDFEVSVALEVVEDFILGEGALGVGKECTDTLEAEGHFVLRKLAFNVIKASWRTGARVSYI